MMAHMGSQIRPRILVIEDDESVTRMLRFSFDRASFDTTQLRTGGEALRILERQPPDAVVLDLQLPDGQGGAVLNRLRQLDEAASGSPVWVVISALDRAEATRRYGPLGNHFLTKPFDPWELVAMLKHLLLAKGEPQQR
jgi:DNA-binding response OmpR family regulator